MDMDLGMGGQMMDGWRLNAIEQEQEEAQEQEQEQVQQEQRQGHTMSYTNKTILLATIPKIPATFSIIGSCLILVYIIKRRRAKRPIQVYHRIMFSMSCSDLIASLVFWGGTFPIPRGTLGAFGPVYWAFGDTHGLSCRICGAWAQLQVLSPLYNGILALYYLLVVKFQWNEQRIKAMEPYLQIVPIVFALTTALLGAIWDVYGSVEWLCWVSDSHTPHYKTYQWIFLFAPVWFCWIFVSVVMLLLYLAMRQLEHANQRYIIPQSQQHNTTANNQRQRQRQRKKRTNEKSRQIAIQGMLYVLAFYTSWFFPSIQRILELVNHPSNFILQLLDTSLLPLQGLLNALIYARPRYLRLQKQYPNLSRWQLLRATYSSSQYPTTSTTSENDTTRYNTRPQTQLLTTTTTGTIRTTMTSTTATIRDHNIRPINNNREAEDEGQAHSNSQSHSNQPPPEFFEEEILQEDVDDDHDDQIEMQATTTTPSVVVPPPPPPPPSLQRRKSSNIALPARTTNGY